MNTVQKYKENGFISKLNCSLLFQYGVLSDIFYWLRTLVPYDAYQRHREQFGSRFLCAICEVRRYTQLYISNGYCKFHHLVQEFQTWSVVVWYSVCITRFLSGPWWTPQSTSTLSATFIAVIMPAGHGVQIAHFPG